MMTTCCSLVHLVVQDLVDEARLFETAATGGDPVLVAHKVRISTDIYIYM
jgi:hypothetical protein